MKVKLMFGDCLERLKEIPDNSIDLILTDMPYGSTKCKWDSILDIDKVWDSVLKVIKINGAVLFFGKEPFSSTVRLKNINYYRYDWVWKKSYSTGFMNVKKMPKENYELISVYYKKQCVYNPIMKKGKPYVDKRKLTNKRFKNDIMGSVAPIRHIVNNGTRYPDRIIEFANPNRNKLHSTQKPIDLLRYLIKTYTLENETVLDFTMGSGSTGVASLIEKRNFIGIENNKEYFKMASNRIKDYKSEIR